MMMELANKILRAEKPVFIYEMTRIVWISSDDDEKRHQKSCRFARKTIFDIIFNEAMHAIGGKKGED